MGSRLSIETFPMPLRRWFFPRYFVFRDEEGAQVGAAGTLWVLFDLEKRCMVAPGDVAGAIPDNSDLTPPLGVPGPVPRLTGETAASARTPVYSELDVNGHVNNARYADWLCDALGLEVMREYRVKTMRLSYAAEIRPGQSMELRLVRDGLAYHLTGSHEGKTHFSIGGQLQKRLKKNHTAGRRCCASPPFRFGLPRPRFAPFPRRTRSCLPHFPTAPRIPPPAASRR